ncbi:MAG: hypothetical protein U0R19_35645 [Bryobacteraceae bacterium]
MRFVFAVAAFFATLCVSAVPAEGATYTASTCGVADSNSTGALVIVLQQNCNSTNFYANGSARADSGGLGASAQYTNFCCSSPFGLDSRAEIRTEFTITGPGPSVLTSLNLALHGVVDTSSSTELNIRKIVLGVALDYGGSYSGELRVTAGNTGTTIESFGELGPPVGMCAIACGLVTPTFTLPTNMNIRLIMNLTAAVAGGIGTSTGYAQAFNSLYFPLDGPVFNLPDGYTASIQGMNVENNRVLVDNSVPEPTTWSLAGAALGCLAVGRRRIAVAR